MSAALHTPPSSTLPAVSFTRWLAVGSLLGLIVLGLAWELWLAPLRPGGSWLVLKVLPLTLPLAGLLKNRMYTYRWVSLLVWLYFTEGAVRATSDSGLSAVLAGIEVLLCVLLFVACALHVRIRLRAAGKEAVADDAARRAAAAHVIFNVVTACVALALLPWLIGALASAREALGLSADPAAMLALFHTTFNVLGVVLMWPLADGLTRWLLQRFRAREEDEAQPRYLDDNVLAVPALALDALEREVARFGQLCVRIAGAVLTGAAPVALVGDRSAMTRLDAAVESFAERLSRLALSKVASERLAEFDCSCQMTVSRR